MEWSILMQMTSVKLMVVGLLGMLLSLGVILWFWRKRKLRTPQGAGQAVERVLSAYARQRGGTTLLTQQVLPDGEQVPFLLVGPFGLVFVQPLGEGPILYGEPRSPRWRVRREGQTMEFPNPLLEMERQMEALRGSFSKAGVYGVPMEPVVVLTSPDKLEVILSGVGQAVPLRGLQGYLTANKRLATDTELHTAHLLELLSAQG